MGRCTCDATWFDHLMCWLLIVIVFVLFIGPVLAIERLREYRHEQ